MPRYNKKLMFKICNAKLTKLLGRPASNIIAGYFISKKMMTHSYM